MRLAGVVALLSTGALLAGCASGGHTTTSPPTTAPPPPPPRLAVYAAGRRLASIEPKQLSGLRLPRRLSIRRGRARLLVEIPHRQARAEIRQALARRARRIDLHVVPVWSAVVLRPVRQLLHNDCEATALSMLLAAAGVEKGQLALQAKLPRSGPLDPEPVAGSTLFRWGDPERGFVGRPDGGGPEGGFGVYEPPVRALAAHFGVRLHDLHGSTLAAVRATVLAGHPVLAWVGLAPGPYLRWLTPEGREITVNLNEHAVVLVGAGPGYVLVNNPLSGERERWSDALFSSRWQLLGRRALALS
jgi:uncharacterized protein YvpB